MLGLRNKFSVFSHSTAPVLNLVGKVWNLALNDLGRGKLIDLGRGKLHDLGKG